MFAQRIRRVVMRFASCCIGRFGSLSGLSRFIKRPAEMIRAQRVWFDLDRKAMLFAHCAIMARLPKSFQRGFRLAQ